MVLSTEVIVTIKSAATMFINSDVHDRPTDMHRVAKTMFINSDVHDDTMLMLRVTTTVTLFVYILLVYIINDTRLRYFSKGVIPVASRAK